MVNNGTPGAGELIHMQSNSKLILGIWFETLNQHVSFRSVRRSNETVHVGGALFLKTQHSQSIQRERAEPPAPPGHSII